MAISSARRFRSTLSRALGALAFVGALALGSPSALAEEEEQQGTPAAEPAPEPAAQPEPAAPAAEAEPEAPATQPTERPAPAAGAPAKAESAPAEGEPPPAQEIPPEFDLPEEPGAYVAALRGAIAKHKEKVLAKIETKFEEKQADKLGKLQAGIALFSLAGFFLLLTPLFLMRRYPGKFWVLAKYSVLACVCFMVTVSMFSNVLLLMKGAQGAAGSLTNPTYSIAEASFDTLGEQAEDLAPIGPALIEAPLARVAAGEEDDFVTAILNNVSAIKADVLVFKKIAGWFKGVSGIFEYLPSILTVVTVIVFILTMRPVLMKIVRLPAAAASGEVTGMSVVKEVFFTLLKEIVITLLVIVVLLFVTVLSGVMLSTLARPAVEALLGYVFVCIFYVLAAKSVSMGWIYVSLVGCIAFLVLNILIVLLCSGSFVGKAQKLLRLRFHERVPLRTQWKFWLLGPIALVWVELVPLLFALVAQPALEHLTEWTMKGKTLADVSWPALLGSGPLILVFGFLLLWLCWGLKPFLFIARFPAKAPPPPEPVANPANEAALAPQPA